MSFSVDTNRVIMEMAFVSQRRLLILFLFCVFSVVLSAKQQPALQRLKGNTVTVSCTSRKLTSLKWMKRVANQTFIPVNSKKIQKSLNEVFLVLKNIKPKDEGYYICQGRRRRRQGSKKKKRMPVMVKHVVVKRGQKLQFKFLNKPWKVKKVPPASNLTINCSTTLAVVVSQLFYRRKPRNKWVQLIPEAHKIKQDGGVFTVVNFEKADAGRYKCKATNQDNATISWSDRKGRTLSVQPGNVPKVQVKQARHGVFKCKAKGQPQPRITWYRNGKPLLCARSRCRIKLKRKRSSTSSSLKLSKRFRRRAAKYTCRAANVLGVSSAEIQYRPK